MVVWGLESQSQDSVWTCKQTCYDDANVLKTNSGDHCTIPKSTKFTKKHLIPSISEYIISKRWFPLEMYLLITRERCQEDYRCSYIRDLNREMISTYPGGNMNNLREWTGQLCKVSPKLIPKVKINKILYLENKRFALLPNFSDDFLTFSFSTYAFLLKHCKHNVLLQRCSFILKSHLGAINKNREYTDPTQLK